MRWDDLVCAACGGRVSDARCPTCRASLRRLQDDAPDLRTFALVGLLLLLFVGVLAHLL